MFASSANSVVEGYRGCASALPRWCDRSSGLSRLGTDGLGDPCGTRRMKSAATWLTATTRSFVGQLHRRARRVIAEHMTLRAGLGLERSLALHVIRQLCVDRHDRVRRVGQIVDLRQVIEGD